LGNLRDNERAADPIVYVEQHIAAAFAKVGGVAAIHLCNRAIEQGGNMAGLVCRSIGESSGHSSLEFLYL